MSLWSLTAQSASEALVFRVAIKAECGKPLAPGDACPLCGGILTLRRPRALARLLRADWRLACAGSGRCRFSRPVPLLHRRTWRTCVLATRIWLEGMRPAKRRRKWPAYAGPEVSTQ
jgi:hypothetical protein